MKRKTMFMMSCAISLILSACGSGDETGTAEESTNETGQKEVLVYSNSLSGERKEWIDELASEEGFTMQYVDSGGGDILNRLLAEVNAPQADVIFGLDEAMFFELANEDLFVTFEPDWVSEIPEEANVGNERFHPLVEQRIFMMYNPEFISEEEAPMNWQDLSANPDFKGRYRVPSGLGGGTDQKVILSILLQYVDEEGEFGIAQEGWDEVEAYLANGYQTPKGEDQLQNFAEGTIPLSYHFLGGIPNAEEEFGFNAVPINPDQGVITMREQIGIINKGDDYDYLAAEDFVNWFGSAEVQSAFVEEFGGLPVNEMAYTSASERLTEIAEATEPMDVDWDFVSENLVFWIEKVELELMP